MPDQLDVEITEELATTAGDPEARHLRAVSDRALQALEMRKAGLNIHQIANQLGYASTEGARKAITSAMKYLVVESGAEDVRNLELARLDEMTLHAWTILRDQSSGARIKLDAIDRLLMIMERRSRYLGLDEAEKIQMTHHGEVEVGVTHIVIDGTGDEYIQSLMDARKAILEQAQHELEASGYEEAIIVDETDSLGGHQRPLRGSQQLGSTDALLDRDEDDVLQERGTGDSLPVPRNLGA